MLDKASSIAIAEEVRDTMDSYPTELDFISLFECFPRKKDEEELFEYDESTFVFNLNDQAFEVMISPFYQKFSLLVKMIEDNETIGYYDFHTVDRIEIISDRREHSAIRLFMESDRERFLTMIEITFKPKFMIIMKEIIC
ncbi:hypothetical protein ACFDTO_33495 [Microbacteriaceae bacterium 4G12]